MRNKPLDDLKDILPEKQVEATPNKFLGVVFLLLGVIVLVAVFATGRTSQTELVEASYLFMPLFAMGIAAYVLLPRKIPLVGFFSVVGLWLFYEIIWPSL